MVKFKLTRKISKAFTEHIDMNFASLNGKTLVDVVTFDNDLRNVSNFLLDKMIALLIYSKYTQTSEYRFDVCISPIFIKQQILTVLTGWKSIIPFKVVSTVLALGCYSDRKLRQLCETNPSMKIESAPLGFYTVIDGLLVCELPLQENGKIINFIYDVILVYSSSFSKYRLLFSFLIFILLEKKGKH
jgi:hypothetical protein